MKPHKHAEVLRAIADGNTVQYRESQDHVWVDRKDDYCDNDPITHDDYFWRIKPEPKQDVVFRTCVSPFIPMDAWGRQVPNIHAVFDAETRQLKSVEVLK